MSTTEMILALRRPTIWAQYKDLCSVAVPTAATTPQEAFQLGLKQGFSLGLITGVGLGLEVGLNFPTTSFFEGGDLALN
jgi:hypothetical protein